jgi:hypothetical protein
MKFKTFKYYKNILEPLLWGDTSADTMTPQAHIAYVIRKSGGKKESSR